MYVGYVLVSEMILHLSHTYARIDTKNMREEKEEGNFSTIITQGKLMTQVFVLKLKTA